MYSAKSFDLLSVKNALPHNNWWKKLPHWFPLNSPDKGGPERFIADSLLFAKSENNRQEWLITPQSSSFLPYFLFSPSPFSFCPAHCTLAKLEKAGDRFGDYLCVHCTNLSCVSGCNQLINTKFNRPITKISKSNTDTALHTHTITITTSSCAFSPRSFHSRAAIFLLWPVWSILITCNWSFWPVHNRIDSISPHSFLPSFSHSR